jgi:hypothetical protein
LDTLGGAVSAIVVAVVLAAIAVAIAAALGAGLLALVIIPIGILLAGWGAAEGRLAHEDRGRRTPPRKPPPGTIFGLIGTV